MSGLYLLVLLFLWLGGLGGGLWVWFSFRPKRPFVKFFFDLFVLGFVVAWIVIPFWVAVGKQIYYHSMIDDLCEKDGGVQVYEVVELTPDKFNRWGQPNFYRPTEGDKALGEGYVFKYVDDTVRAQSPEIVRSHVQVFRRSDLTLLGESISYHHRYAGLPGPWHTPGYGCKHVVVGTVPLLSKIFSQKEGL